MKKTQTRRLGQHFIDSAYEAEAHFCWSWVVATGQPCRLYPSLDPQNLQTDAPEKNVSVRNVGSVRQRYLLIIPAQQSGAVGQYSVF